MAVRKIMVSSGYGAGWVSWASPPCDEAALDMVTWPAMVEALERGELLSENHPAVVELVVHLKDAYDMDEPYYGGLRDLYVAEVTGQFKITEYDGSESFEERMDDKGWLG